jgi:hypothetical protein
MGLVNGIVVLIEQGTTRAYKKKGEWEAARMKGRSPGR